MFVSSSKLIDYLSFHNFNYSGPISNKRGECFLYKKNNVQLLIGVTEDSLISFEITYYDNNKPFSNTMSVNNDIDEKETSCEIFTSKITQYFSRLSESPNLRSYKKQIKDVLSLNGLLNLENEIYEYANNEIPFEKILNPNKFIELDHVKKHLNFHKNNPNLKLETLCRYTEQYESIKNKNNTEAFEKIEAKAENIKDLQERMNLNKK